MRLKRYLAAVYNALPLLLLALLYPALGFVGAVSIYGLLSFKLRCGLVMYSSWSCASHSLSFLHHSRIPKKLWNLKGSSKILSASHDLPSCMSMRSMSVYAGICVRQEAVQGVWWQRGLQQDQEGDGEGDEGGGA